MKKTGILLSIFISILLNHQAFSQNCTVNADIDKQICANDQLLLDGNSQGLIHTAAKWGQAEGPNVQIIDASNLRSPVTGFMGNNIYTFVISATCHDGTIVSDVVDFTIKPITIATTGDSIIGCPGTYTLSANTPDTSETGKWSVVGSNAAGASFSSASSPNSGITLAGNTSGTATVRWTISNSNGCESYSEITVTNYGGEMPVTAGSDIALDQCYSAFQDTDLSASYGGSGLNNQQGTWTLVSGPNYPIFNNINNNNTNVNQLVEGTYVLRWEVTGECASGNDEVSITVLAATQDVSNAVGESVHFCNGADQAVLFGSNPLYANETVTWTQTSGPSEAIIADPNSSTTLVSGLDGSSTYSFAYKIESTTGCQSTDNGINISYVAPASISVGNHIIAPCDTQTVAVPITRNGGSQGRYRIVEGPYTTDWSSNGMSGSASQDVNIRFTESGTFNLVFEQYSNGFECGNAFGNLSVSISSPPTESNAGTNQILACNIVETELAGNTPEVGVGFWSQVSGPNTANIVDATNRSSTIDGLIAGVYTFRWSISNGLSCANQEDEVSVTVSTPTNTTVALGIDQTVCYNSEVLLQANPTAANEVGVWSVDKTDGVAISDIHDPSPIVTGLAASTAYTFTWKITNPCTPSTQDDVLIETGSAIGPSNADAGPDQCKEAGTTTITLNGNTPEVGTGTWSVVSGPTGFSITKPNQPNSTLTGMANGDYLIEWAVTVTGCQINRDTLEVTIAPEVSTSNAGNDKNVCGNEVKMSANSPINGSGVWTRIYGNAGYHISNSTSPTATFSNLLPGSYQFAWVVSEGVCPQSTDTIHVFVSETPSISDAGLTQTVCNGTTAPLSANVATTGNGYWTVAGNAPNSPQFTNITAPVTTVSGLVSGNYSFRWNISTGPNCLTEFSDVLIQVSAPANAGNDQSLCNSNVALLTGTKGTSGTWTESSGIGAVITANTSYTAIASNLVFPNTYTFDYATPSLFGCNQTTDQLTVGTSPYGSEPNAGTDQEVCLANTTTINLNGSLPATGSGTWFILAAPNTPTYTEGDANTLVTNLNEGVYVFEWNVAYDLCATYKDVMRLEVYDAPSTANAGTNQTNACQLSATLDGNLPAKGIGTWTLVGAPTGGTLTIENPNLPNSQITNPTIFGTYVFEWKITNGSICAASTDQVSITFNNNPPSTAQAGLAQELCNSNSATMAATAATNGIGTWTQVSGPVSGTIASANSPTTQVSGLTENGVYLYNWEVVSGTCSLTDEVQITIGLNPSLASAGDDREVCEYETLTLSGNDPTPLTGEWSYVAGSVTPFIETPFSHQTKVFGTVPGTFGFNWHVSSNSCGSLDGQIEITVLKQPEILLEMNGSTICESETASVTILSSELNINYTVFLGFNQIASGKGDGNNLIIDIQSTDLEFGKNILSVKAQNSDCEQVPMTENVTITLNQLPQTNLTINSGNICENELASVTLVASENKVAYKAFAGSTEVGAATGNGSDLKIELDNMLLNLGDNTITLTAKNSTCGETDMQNSVIITIIALPLVDLVVEIADAELCENTDTEVWVQNTESDVIYTLHNDADDSLIGESQQGNGGTLTFVTGSLAGNTTYHIMASRNGCAATQLNQTVSVTVLPCGKPPVAEDDQITIIDFEEVSIPVLDNDTDPDNDIDRGSVVIITNPTYGTTEIDEDGNIHYTPNFEFDNNDFITYRVYDEKGYFDEADVLISGCPIFVPEGFSPNGDLINDKLIVEGAECEPVEIIILNRWGNIVFRTKDYQNDWDGHADNMITAGGGLLPEGTYFYIINRRDKETKKGYFYLKY